MKIFNKCGNGLLHNLNGEIYFVANDAMVEVPDTVAKVWLKINGVTEYVALEDLEKLKAENKALKAKATAKKTTTKKTTTKKAPAKKK